MSTTKPWKLFFFRVERQTDFQELVSYARGSRLLGLRSYLSVKHVVPAVLRQSDERSLKRYTTMVSSVFHEAEHIRSAQGGGRMLVSATCVQLIAVLYGAAPVGMISILDELRRRTSGGGQEVSVEIPTTHGMKLILQSNTGSKACTRANPTKEQSASATAGRPP